MLTVVTYCWGQRYPLLYVRRLVAAVKRNLKKEHQFICFSDHKMHAVDGVRMFRLRDQEAALTKFKGCFARLALFDPAIQREIGATGRILCLDLDLIVTGPLDDILDKRGPFTIVQGINTTNPCPYNGSMWMLNAGYRPDIWSDFSIEAASKIPRHAFPDDQGWFWAKIAEDHAGVFSPNGGVYGFKKKGWPSGDNLPANARVVAFPGWRDPIKFEHLPWVMEHWC